MKFSMIPVLAGLLMGAAVAQAEPDGQELYRHNCAKCHGEDGHATTWRGYLFFARDFTDPAWQDKHSDGVILKRINKGPGFMPAFADRLSDSEREALVRVVRGFRAP